LGVVAGMKKPNDHNRQKSNAKKLSTQSLIVTIIVHLIKHIGQK